MPLTAAMASPRGRGVPGRELEADLAPLWPPLIGRRSPASHTRSSAVSPDALQNSLLKVEVL